MMDDELCACGRGLHMLLTTCGSACACPLGCVAWETEVHGSTDMKGWAGGAAGAAAISQRAAALMQRPSSSSRRALHSQGYLHGSRLHSSRTTPRGVLYVLLWLDASW